VSNRRVTPHFTKPFERGTLGKKFTVRAPQKSIRREGRAEGGGQIAWVKFVEGTVEGAWAEA